MTDTNSTTTADETQATSESSARPSDGQASTSGSPAQPSTTENAGTKADAGDAHNTGETPAEPTVSQAAYDSLKHDYETAIDAFKAMQHLHEETKAYASSLAVQLSTAQTELAEAKQTAQGRTVAIYATAEEEIEGIKTRLHDVLAESKALSARLADLVPQNHPGRELEEAVSNFIQKVRAHF